MSGRPLTDKQSAFVDEYLVDLNATAAAGRAGYSDPNYGRQLVTKPNVASAISSAMEKRSVRVEVTADDVLRELARIGFADVRDLFEWDEESASFVPSRDLTADQAAAIQSVKAKTTHYVREDGERETKIELELRTHDKLAALREIGKHLGIAQKHEHSGKIQHEHTVQVEDLTDEELFESRDEALKRAMDATFGPTGG